MTTPSAAGAALRVAVLTVSDTRTAATDASGAAIVERLVAAGHDLVARAIVPDDVPAIRERLGAWIDAPDVEIVITTGGTGFSPRDVTPDALATLATRDIPGFGELFRRLSWDEIGTSTIQSRACAAQCGDTFVFCLPGSPGAVRTAMERILLPQLDLHQRPCNFAELVPRLRKPPA